MEQPDLLAGAWRKLWNARNHLHTLERDVVAFCRNAAPLYSFRKELTSRTGRGRYVVSRVREFPLDWALPIGDVLNNSRTALDHLAWVLVKCGATATPPKPTRVQFPICTSADDLETAIRDRLPGVKPEYVKKIRDRQPIPGTPHFTTFSCLSDLADMNRIDKHRELHTVVGLHTGSTASLHSATDFQLTELRYTEESAPLPVVMRPGTELLQFEGNVTGPSPDVEIRLRGAVTPTFENGKPVIPLLAGIVRAVDQLLGAFDGAL